jgi:type VI protein secretion system component VasF
MTSSEKDNLQRRLEDLAAEINQVPPRVSVHPPAAASEKENSLAGLKQWLNRLPPAARIAIFAIAIVLAFSLLNLVLRLVASLLSVAILAIILYVVYKVLFAPSPPSQ